MPFVFVLLLLHAAMAMATQTTCSTSDWRANGGTCLDNRIFEAGTHCGNNNNEPPCSESGCCRDAKCGDIDCSQFDATTKSSAKDTDLCGSSCLMTCCAACAPSVNANLYNAQCLLTFPLPSTCKSQLTCATGAHPKYTPSNIVASITQQGQQCVWTLTGCDEDSCSYHRAHIEAIPCDIDSTINNNQCGGSCNPDKCCTKNTCKKVTDNGGYDLGSDCSQNDGDKCTVNGCLPGYERNNDPLQAVCETIGGQWTLKGCSQKTCGLKNVGCDIGKIRDDSKACGTTAEPCDSSTCCFLPKCAAKDAAYSAKDCNNQQTCASSQIACAAGYQKATPSTTLTAGCAKIDNDWQWVFSGCIPTTCDNFPINCADAANPDAANGHLKVGTLCGGSNHDACTYSFCCGPSECTIPDQHDGYDITTFATKNCDHTHKDDCGVSCSSGYYMDGGVPPAWDCLKDGDPFVFSGCTKEPNKCEYKFTGSQHQCPTGWKRLDTKDCIPGADGYCSAATCCQPNNCAAAEIDNTKGCGNTCNCPNKQSCESGNAKFVAQCVWDPDALNGEGMCKRLVPFDQCTDPNGQPLIPSTCYIVDNGCGNGKCGSCGNSVSCGNQVENGCEWVAEYDANGKDIGFCTRKSQDPDECGCKCFDVDCVSGYKPTDCSRDCGKNGVVQEKCVVTTQKYANGKGCTCKAGLVQKTDIPCNRFDCKTDEESCGGEFIDGECSATCGTGVMVQTYMMLKKNKDYSSECLANNGTMTRTVACSVKKCRCKTKKVKSGCNCGKGKKYESNEITEDGEDCPEKSEAAIDDPDQTPCDPADLIKCPVKCDAYWADVGVCSVSCGGGNLQQRYTYTAKYNAEIAINPNSPDACTIAEGTTITVACATKDCDCDGEWEHNSDGKGCSKSCGAGTQKKKWHDKHRNKPECDSILPPNEHETDEPCNKGPCNPDDDLPCDAEWKIVPGAKCSEDCGDGEIDVVYKVKKGANNCLPFRDGDLSTQPCNEGDCPEDCIGAPWKSNCTKSCGGGHRFKKYFVLVPPKHGGQKCPLEHNSKKISNCNSQPCPEDCEGQWVKEKCTAGCGGGWHVSKFKVHKPANNDGAPCDADDGESFSVPCNTHPCPQDCEGDWEEGECSKSCHGGTRVKTWKIHKYAANKGKPCDLAHGATKIEKCNEGECIYDCKGEWVEHEGCSKSCGGGTKRHEFKYTQHPTPGRGKDCVDENGVFLKHGAEKFTSCHQEPCDVDCSGGWWDEEENTCTQPCAPTAENRGTITKVFHVKHGRHGNGKPCLDDQGAPIEEGDKRDFPCNLHLCGDDCVGYWTGGDHCSKSCGWGITTLTYNVFKPAENGGHDCDHHHGKQITKPCHVASCPRAPSTPSTPSEHEPLLPPVPPPEKPREGTDCEGYWDPGQGECSKTCGWGHILETYTVVKPKWKNGRDCEHTDRKTRTVPCRKAKCGADVTSSTSDDDSSGTAVDCIGGWKPTKCSKECGGGHQIHQYVVLRQPKNGKYKKANKCSNTDGEETEGPEPCNTHQCPTQPNVCTRPENRDYVMDGNIKRHGCGWTCKCPNEVSCKSGRAKDNCFWNGATKQCLRIVAEDDAECKALEDNGANAVCFGMDAPTKENGCGKGCHCPNQQSCEGPLKKDDGTFINKKCSWVSDEEADTLLDLTDPLYADFKGKGGYCLRNYSGDESYKCQCSCGAKKCRAHEYRDPKAVGGCGWTCACPTKESCEDGVSKTSVTCKWTGPDDAKGKGFCQPIVREDQCDELGSTCYVLHKELLTDDDKKSCDGKNCACNTRDTCELHGHMNCKWVAGPWDDENGFHREGTCHKFEDNNDPNNKKNPPCGCQC